MEAAMTETQDVSARLCALETVLRHLLTHLALRNDDPPRWVATRRVLALHEVQEHAPWVADAVADAETRARLAGIEHAISGLFDPVEGVMAAYGTEHAGTTRTGLR
jgi:hypothetical protein